MVTSFLLTLVVSTSTQTPLKCGNVKQFYQTEGCCSPDASKDPVCAYSAHDEMNTYQWHLTKFDKAYVESLVGRTLETYASVTAQDLVTLSRSKNLTLRDLVALDYVQKTRYNQIPLSNLNSVLKDRPGYGLPYNSSHLSATYNESSQVASIVFHQDLITSATMHSMLHFVTSLLPGTARIVKITSDAHSVFDIKSMPQAVTSEGASDLFYDFLEQTLFDPSFKIEQLTNVIRHVGFTAWIAWQEIMRTSDLIFVTYIDGLCGEACIELLFASDIVVSPRDDSDDATAPSTEITCQATRGGTHEGAQCDTILAKKGVQWGRLLTKAILGTTTALPKVFGGTGQGWTTYADAYADGAVDILVNGISDFHALVDHLLKINDRSLVMYARTQDAW